MTDIRGRLTRREFLHTALGALAGVAPELLFRLAPTVDYLAQPQTPEGKAPSVIYIMADQLRSVSLGCYGNPEISTPHIGMRIKQLAHQWEEELLGNSIEVRDRRKQCACSF